jgi:hypothetical protein
MVFLNNREKTPDGACQRKKTFEFLADEEHLLSL